jgi:hypothetical protein
MSTVNSNDSGKPSERPTDFNALLELFDEITGSVPEESWEKMPPDLSKNIDHYLYGCPKKRMTEGFPRTSKQRRLTFR